MPSSAGGVTARFNQAAAADSLEHPLTATVLVIEDDEMVAEVVRINLSAEGYEVVHAPSGPAGLAVAAQQHPDVVLLDIVLPDTGGWEILERLREETHDDDLPIIVMASRAMPADRVRGYNSGATAYLNKPFTAAELSEKVREAVEDSSPQP